MLVLDRELISKGLIEKVNCGVKDEGSNLRTCTRVLGERTVVPLGLSTFFDGPCLAHLLSNACNSALSTTVDVELSMINSKESRSALQNWITGAKKRAKG